MGDYDHLTGELWPGAYGWLPLAANPGPPSGPATLEPPPKGPDVYACHVYCDPNFPEAPGYGLTTSTGAPVTDSMNSNVDKRDDYSAQYQSAPPPTGWKIQQVKKELDDGN